MQLLESLSASMRRCGAPPGECPTFDISFHPVRDERGEVVPTVPEGRNITELKYRKQKAPLEIHISVEPDGNQWIVSLRNNGIGFEPQYAERIFGLFKRLHNDEYPDTGLGLAICQRIVERSGGPIWAESRLGEGATFRFSLARVKGQ